MKATMLELPDQTRTTFLASKVRRITTSPKKAAAEAVEKEAEVEEVAEEVAEVPEADSPEKAAPREKVATGAATSKI